MQTPVIKWSLLALAAAGIALIALSPDARSSTPQPTVATSHVLGVRVSYVDLAGNHPHTDCTVNIVNKSLTESLIIEQFIVLGPDGRNDIKGIAHSAVGHVLEPLSEYRVPINQTVVNGLAPQVTRTGDGARNAILKLAGPRDAIHVEALHERYATGQTDQRTHWVTRGYFTAD